MIQYPKYCLVWDTVPKYYLVWDTGPKIQYPGLVWDDTVSKIPSGLGWYSTQNTDWFGMIQYPKYCLVWDDTVPKNTVWFRMIQYPNYCLVWDTVPEILSSLGWYSTQNTVWFGIAQYTPYCLIWDCTVCTILIWTVYIILSDTGLYSTHHADIKLYSMHHTVWFGLYHMYHNLWFGIVQHALCWFGIVQYAPYCLIWVCMVCIVLSDLGLYAMHHTVWFGIVQYAPYCLILDDTGSKLWVWKLKGYIRTCEVNPSGIFHNLFNVFSSLS